MRSLRWVGLACSLLIVGVLGVLGVLMAPLAAEAAVDPKTGSYMVPTVTITVEYDYTVPGTGVKTHYKTVNDVPLMATTGTGVSCSTTVPSGETKSDSSTYQYCYALRAYVEDFYQSGYTNATDQLARGSTALLYGPQVGVPDNNGNSNPPFTRQFKIVDYDASHKARLLITDTSSAEKLTDTGTVIVPVADSDPTWADSSKGADSNDRVTVTLTYHNVFNLAPNSTVAATCTSANDCSSSTYYALGLGLAGAFCNYPGVVSGGGHSCDAATTQYNVGGVNYNVDALDNKFSMTGFGTFSKTVGQRNLTNTTNPVTKLDFPTASILDPPPAIFTWNKTQVTKFPGYVCNNGWSSTNTASITNPISGTTTSYTAAKCTPDVTVSVILRVDGPDAVQLKDSPKHVAGNPICKGNSNKKCVTADDAIASDLSDAVTDELTLSAGIDAADECGPTICNATIQTSINVTPAPPAGFNTFSFFGSGPSMPAVIPIVVDTVTGDGNGIPDITTLRSGGGGTPYTISASYPDSFPPVLNSVGSEDKNTIWSVDQINCSSANLSTVIGTDTVVTLTTLKAVLTIYKIGDQDTLVCRWHAHKATYVH